MIRLTIFIWIIAIFRSIFTIETAVIFFIAIIILAHLFVPGEYDWKVNTISDLGAQEYKNAWIMHIGFIGFGILMCIAIIQMYFQSGEKNYSDLLIALYATSVLLTGIWSTAPFMGAGQFSISEDKLHSLFAQIAGFTFSFGILWHLLVYANPKEKWLHFVFLILIIGLSGLVWLSKNGMITVGLGLIQRGLYIISFIWLLFRYH